MTQTAALPSSQTRPERTEQNQRKGGRIFFRTASMSGGIIIFTVLIFLAAIIPQQRRQLIDELHQRALVVQTSVAQVLEESLVMDEPSKIVDHCLSIVSQNPSIGYVVLTPKEGPSLIHTPDTWRQEELNGRWRPKTSGKNTEGTFITNPFGAKDLFHISYAFEYIGQSWGWIHLGLSTDKFRSDSRSLYKRSGLIAGLSVSAGLFLSLLYARRLSVPILELERLARRIASGDLTQRIRIRTGDEVEHLATTFNYMIDELQQANREREKVQKKLVDTARQAGMAEMISNVLHNVGNVLNSVGVTAAVMKQELSQSKHGSLTRLANMIQEQGDDLAAFLTRDPRGQKIPAYFVSLSEHLVGEQQTMLTHMADLERHIEHVRQIIHIQQDYSKTHGLIESVNISEIIVDALRFNREQNARYDIDVQTSFEPLPECWIDRLRLLQILTNLLSNARHALVAQAQSPKILQIKLARKGENLIHITVADNGIGIEPDDLTRIFQHGFTTRKKGHGFGLHSSAIAARELSGSLMVTSAGKGRGAVFVIEFPFRPVEAAHET